MLQAPGTQPLIGIHAYTEAPVACAQGNMGLVAAMVVAASGDAEMVAPGNGQDVLRVLVSMLTVPGLYAAKPEGKELFDKFLYPAGRIGLEHGMGQDRRGPDFCQQGDRILRLHDLLCNIGRAACPDIAGKSFIYVPDIAFGDYGPCYVRPAY